MEGGGSGGLLAGVKNDRSGTVASAPDDFLLPYRMSSNVSPEARAVAAGAAAKGAGRPGSGASTMTREGLIAITASSRLASSFFRRSCSSSSFLV
jgi:hypothetical protein